ncbi:conserved hypothetical protein [Ricinus communis]|uniref:Uncharacterized protein n=1 Tax=Ricinus communis TaxID=3988 RepID=B9RAF3_RICCO|nr:conserved hypothetical protein [Ricinus communis]
MEKEGDRASLQVASEGVRWKSTGCLITSRELHCIFLTKWYHFFLPTSAAHGGFTF